MRCGTSGEFVCLSWPNIFQRYMASLATCVINVYSGVNCPPQRHITNNQLKVETKTSFSGSSSRSPRPRCTAVPVLKYNLGMGMKHYYLVWPCVVRFAQLSVARRQAIHVDCVKVFPVSIVELSQGCVSDCGSDSVGGEGYSANVFVRSPLPYLSLSLSFRHSLQWKKRCWPYISRVPIFLSPTLDQISLAGDGIPVPRKLSIPKRSGTQPKGPWKRHVRESLNSMSCGHSLLLT